MKFVMQAPLFGKWLTADDLSGFGTEYTTLSLREDNGKGKPGKRVLMSGPLSKADVLGLAFSLLDIADQMQLCSTYATSDTVGSSMGEPRPHNQTFSNYTYEFKEGDSETRRRETVARFELVRRRMPTLQLLQRVLERCDDEVADTLGLILMMADQTGALPFSAGVAVAPQESIAHHAGDDTLKH